MAVIFIIGCVVEIAVIVFMNTHMYEFMGKTYLQQFGGPIGMRATASLAAVVMKVFDVAWMNLCKRENLSVDLFLRYVDDCRILMAPLNEGWFWNGCKFEFSWERRKSDLKCALSDQQRTTIEITKAMTSIVSFLNFTGEDCSMFQNCRLPTLDCEVWFEDGKIQYSFYEKPQVGNRVLQKDTALPVSTLRSSLLQEVVRRLSNCSLSLDLAEKQTIISKFAQKLVNSSHSNASARITLVQGVTKYLENVRLSKLPSNHCMFKPLHLGKSFNCENRQLKKYMDKMCWYEKPPTNKPRWRGKLVGKWRGDGPTQMKVKGMPYSSVIMVPNTLKSALANALALSEPKLAKRCGYQVKICETSGTQLSKLFTIPTSRTCEREKCYVCMNHGTKGSSKCKKLNVVYEAKCLLCLDEVKQGVRTEDKVGTYVGETSRTCFERSSEHVNLALNGDEKSFIVKHWSNEHFDSEVMPQVKFEVVKSHKGVLSRVVHEAVRIESRGNLNSKSEWGSHHRPRLVIEKSEWEERKVVSERSESEKQEANKIKILRERIEKMKSKKCESENVELDKCESGTNSNLKIKPQGTITKACKRQVELADEVGLSRDEPSESCEFDTNTLFNCRDIRYFCAPKRKKMDKKILRCSLR